MKRMTATIAALALTLCVLTGAAGWAEEKQTAANLFECDGHGILVSVDLRDGWSIEFGLNATYLFDGENDGNRDAAAYGVYVSPEEYEEIIDEYSDYDSFREWGIGEKLHPFVLGYLSYDRSKLYAGHSLSCFRI